MSRFVFGFLCGVVVMLLNPTLRWPTPDDPSKHPATPAPTPPPTPARDWMEDSKRGLLNQPAHQ